VQYTTKARSAAALIRLSANLWLAKQAAQKLPRSQRHRSQIRFIEENPKLNYWHDCSRQHCNTNG
jgi:hypothetical protein